jgi:glycosyltransferase involved in cell wall biosynthesis
VAHRLQELIVNDSIRDLAGRSPLVPKVSIVVASKVGAPFLDQCLASLSDQARSLDAETIVVAAGSSARAKAIAADFPWTKVIHAPELSNVPALRRRGTEAAAGEYVAVIEEHCSAAPDWLATALAAHALGRYAAVGGPIVDFDYDRVPDWVVYFLEYNAALPPAPEGETSDLNDANIVYRRDALMAHAAILADGYWPMTLHPRLLASGGRFLSVPRMVVHHRGPLRFGYYLRQRYLFSRAFAGVRARNESPLRRWVYVFAAPLIPFFLLARMAATVLKKRCRVAKFVQALPLLGPAVVVLVAGEWVGCVLGPGDALSKVE